MSPVIAAFVVKEARASCTELCSPSRTDCIASQSIGRAELAAMSYPRFLRLCFATSPHDRVGADAFDIDGVALSTADAIDALVAHGIAAAFVSTLLIISACRAILAAPCTLEASPILADLAPHLTDRIVCIPSIRVEPSSSAVSLSVKLVRVSANPDFKKSIPALAFLSRPVHFNPACTSKGTGVDDMTERAGSTTILRALLAIVDVLPPHFIVHNRSADVSIPERNPVTTVFGAEVIVSPIQLSTPPKLESIPRVLSIFHPTYPHATFPEVAYLSIA